MRTSIALAAGLVALASAGTTTITDTVDVTITSCEPTVTNCPYKGGAGSDGSNTWGDWSVSASTTSSPAKVTSTSYSWDPTWSDWSASVSSTSTKPAATSTSWDPTWSDWSDGSYSTSTAVSPASTDSAWDGTWSDWASSTWATTATPVSAVTTYATGAWSSPVAAASTGIWSYTSSGSPVAPAVATYTGAANVNAGSFALAGLAAAAALVIA